MEAIRSFYRRETPDCPLEVSYFSPSQIEKEPNHIQSNSRMMVTLVYNGRVEIFTGGKMQILTDGDIHILPPNALYTFRTTQMGTRYVLLDFSLDLITLPQTHFFQQRFVEPLRAGLLKVPQLVKAGDELYPVLLQEMRRLDVAKEGTDAYTAELFSVVIAICTAIMPYCTTATAKELSARAREDAVFACVEYISEHYAQRLTLQTLAELVHLQPNYLCALFKERTGRTVFEHLTRFRISQTAKLLRSTVLPVNQIAERCGFTSISFFSRKFQKVIGCSPTAYRKRFAAPDITADV